jgi:DNA-binding CsgD family transcriptional regulator
MTAATLGHTADVRGEVAATEDALESARRAGKPELLVHALSLAAFHSLWFGEPEDVRTDRTSRYLAEAQQIEDALPVTQVPALVLWTPKSIRASWATQAEDLDEARRLYDEQCVRATEVGDDSSLNGLLLFRADVERRAGNFVRALQLATGAYEVGERNGDAQGQAAALTELAAVRAMIGPLEQARAASAQALVAAVRVGDRFRMFLGRAIAAVIDSCVADYAAVVEAVGTLPEELEAYGRSDPAIRLWLAAGDEIEARIALGDLALARRRIGQLEERSRRLGRPRGLGVALRGRGLLLAAGGNLPGSLEAFEASLAEHEGIQAPYERARTLLTLGTVQRRAKQKRAARESLQAALAILEELGAAPWAEKAQSELKRISGRAGSGNELTPTERRVAALVAEGRTNREVAATLFVTPRTVEWNLTKIYAKLGVRSRSELARRLPSGNAFL